MDVLRVTLAMSSQDGAVILNPDFRRKLRTLRAGHLRQHDMSNYFEPTPAEAFPSRGLQFERGAEHLCLLGPRATAEFLMEHAKNLGCAGALCEQFHKWQILTPEAIKLAGGDRFPPHLYVVPR
jgi:hypothetical protein